MLTGYFINEELKMLNTFELFVKT